MRSPVFIVDDSELLVELLVEIVGAQPDLVVCGTARSGEEALAVLTGDEAPACALALVDIRMPGMNGLELVRRLAEAVPALPCLVVSAHAEEVYVSGARTAGARGYVMKGNPPVLLEAIRQVLHGETHFAASLMRT